MIIDIHAHAFPDALAKRAVSLLAERAQVEPLTDGTCAGLVASMRSAGVDRSVVMPIATKPEQVASINNWAIDINSRFEELICFGTLHPDQQDYRQEIDRLKDKNVRGIKLHPDYQEFFVDDPRLLDIYRSLSDAGLIVMVHAGVDIGLPPPVHCTPERLAKVLEQVPDLKIIAAHMGGYALWDQVEQFLLGMELYLDTSFSLADLGPKRMSDLITGHGVDRVLFGTDSPWTGQKAEVEGIRSLDLSDQDIDKILGENASALLGI